MSPSRFLSWPFAELELGLRTSGGTGGRDTRTEGSRDGRTEGRREGGRDGRTDGRREGGREGGREGHYLICPKVSQFEVEVFVKHTVLWFDVSVEHSYRNR